MVVALIALAVLELFFANAKVLDDVRNTVMAVDKLVADAEKAKTCFNPEGAD
jgi:hypothetical protein